MLLSKSSRNRLRRPLGRSKSTNSILRDHSLSFVSIEPWAAERDAYIAATLSYHRAQAQDRHSCDMPATPRSSGSRALGRSDSVASGVKASRSNSMVEERHDASPGNCDLQKRQSVRFAGPNARPRRPLAARANQVLLPSTNSRVDDVQRPAECRVQMSSSENGSQPYNNSEAARSFCCVDQPPHVTLVADGNMDSMPHALGRLHKSRSMFIPSVSPTSELEVSNDPAERLKEWLAMPQHPSEDKENEPTRSFGTQGLRAPKSMSFLRGHSVNGHSRTSSRADDDPSGSLAQQSLPNRGACRRLKSQSSMLFRSKHRRYDSSVGLPKSLRSSSNNSAALSSAFSSDTIPVTKKSSLRVTARKVSRTLKSKLMGLFGRPRSVEDMMEAAPKLPPSADSDSESCHRMGNAPEHEEASVCRVTSHVPSLHAVSSNQRLHSRQGSLESMTGDQNLTVDDKSRVTSWTNSSVNTVLSQSSAVDWERQRLSVIKEGAMHVPSSAMPHSKSLLLRSGAPTATGPLVPTINSQRVYSALVKRLRETRQQVQNLDNEEGAKQTPLEVLACDSSVGNDGARTSPPPTIRCVQDEDDVFQDTGDFSSLQEDSDSPAKAVIRYRKDFDSQRSTSYKAYPDPTAGDGMGLSPHKTTHKPDCDAPRGLEHGSDFATSPPCHLFRAASPFRRALQGTMRETQECEHSQDLDIRYLSMISAISLPTRRPSIDGSERDLRMTYAESVYSTATEDARPCQPMADAIMADDALPFTDIHRHGDASTFAEPLGYKSVLAHSRDFSSASSVEWKTWLSANVSKLETSSLTLSTDIREVSHALPLNGHVREAAEIESSSDPRSSAKVTPGHLANTKPLNSMVDSPCQRLTQVQLNKRAAAKGKATLEIDENIPNTAGKRIKASRAGGPPAIPSRSSLRTVPSLTSVKASTGGQEGRTGEVLPRMRSLGTVANATSLTQNEQLSHQARYRLDEAGASSTQTSPGLSAAVKRQFCKASKGPLTRGHGSSSQHDGQTPGFEDDGPQETTFGGSNWDAQVRGSKRMVDLFLSSRRKRIKGSRTGTETGGESMSAAFL